MSTSTSRVPPRQRRAAELLRSSERLARERVLAVHCARGHHVAGVYRTAEGAVVQAASGRRSHGHRDRIDTPHADRADVGWADFLDAGPLADDTVPAWCDCGSWTLSRREMAQWIDNGEGRVLLQ